MQASNLLEIVGALVGIFGTAWLAYTSRVVFATFVLYGVSNICWIAYAVQQRDWWMLAMNGAYAVTTAIGLARLKHRRFKLAPP
jgi:hypothetical protein